MRDGVRVLNVARGGLIDEEALKDALDCGQGGRRRARRLPQEPMTESPLFAYPNVIVTPHLGASTAEATDRAGYQSAEQVVAALTGGVVSTAVNIPAIAAEDMEMLGPFLPLATQLGRLAMKLAEGSSVERIEAAFLGRIADFDTRLLGLAVIVGALQGRTEEQVNLVNAPTMAHQRGIVFEEKVVSEAEDFNELIRVTVIAGAERVAVAGTGIGPEPRAPPRRGPGPAADDRARAARDRVPLRGPARDDRARRHDLRRPRDQHLLGRRRSHPGRRQGARAGLAAMVVTTDAAVPEEVLAEIVASEGFVDGWSVDLD